MHPEVKVLDKELQEGRYKHQEEKRIDRIKMAVEKRKEIMNESITKTSRSKNLDESSSLINPSSTAIKEEQKRLERLKNKQIWELQAMINNKNY